MPKKIPSPTLGENLKARREALGLRGIDVASRAGISHTAYYHYEGDRRSPTVDMLTRIAEALDCDPADLCPGKKKRKNPPPSC